MFKLIGDNYSSQAFSHPPFIPSLKCICHPDNSRRDMPSIVSVMIQVGGTGLLAGSHDREKFPVTTVCLKRYIWQPCLVPSLPASASPPGCRSTEVSPLGSLVSPARLPAGGKVGGSLRSPMDVALPAWQHCSLDRGKGLALHLLDAFRMPNLPPAARPKLLSPVLLWSFRACETVLFQTCPRGVKMPSTLQSFAWSGVPWAQLNETGGESPNRSLRTLQIPRRVCFNLQSLLTHQCNDWALATLLLAISHCLGCSEENLFELRGQLWRSGDPQYTARSCGVRVPSHLGKVCVDQAALSLRAAHLPAPGTTVLHGLAETSQIYAMGNLFVL